MPVAPLGPMSIALAKARQIVASCAEFVTRTGAADAVGALAFAFVDDRPNEPLRDANGDLQAEPITTWATVFEFSGDTEYELERLKSERGSTMVSLFRQRPEELKGSRMDALMDFRNFAGLVLVQILELAKQPISGGSDWYLGVRKVRQVIPASWCEPINEEESAPFLMATFLLEWV
jgi:hypothetical protein